MDGYKRDDFMILHSSKIESWGEQLPYVVEVSQKVLNSSPVLSSGDNAQFWEGKKTTTWLGPPEISKNFYHRFWHIDSFCEATSLFLNNVNRKQQMAKLLANAFILVYIHQDTSTLTWAMSFSSNVWN